MCKRVLIVFIIIFVVCLLLLGVCAILDITARNLYKDYHREELKIKDCGEYGIFYTEEVEIEGWQDVKDRFYLTGSIIIGYLTIAPWIFNICLVIIATCIIILEYRKEFGKENVGNNNAESREMQENQQEQIIE